MDKKTRNITGLGLIVAGVVSLAIQYHMMLKSGSFMVIGMISSVLIVMGVATLFFNVDMRDSQVTNPDGSKANISFRHLPTSIKVTMALALIAALAQLAFFKYGPILY